MKATDVRKIAAETNVKNPGAQAANKVLFKEGGRSGGTRTTDAVPTEDGDMVQQEYGEES